ncbi:MAG: Gar1/Naf1 family protein [Candidatus Bathyarchaeota archaeon]|nr:Gar1/Naf1 family protein [Candidatus Bathyarchaeota archaeon]MCZ2845425.1 Gar1/Naf1 family protein [Candidatus Bathyarchaeota archaeon]
MMALRRLGKVLHSTKNKSLIVILESDNPFPKIGTKTFNKKLFYVGTIKDIIGKVSSPYATIKPETQDFSKYVGEILYSISEKD